MPQNLLAGKNQIWCSSFFLFSETSLLVNIEYFVLLSTFYGQITMANPYILILF